MYIIVFTFQLTATAYVSMVASTLLVHAFGSCCLFMAFVEDITADVIALNKHEHKQKKRKKRSELQFYDQLSEFIQFHSEIKQLSLHFSQFDGFQPDLITLALVLRLLTKAGDTYSLIFTSNLLWTISTLAVLLVSLQMELVE